MLWYQLSGPGEFKQCASMTTAVLSLPALAIPTNISWFKDEQSYQISGDALMYQQDYDINIKLT